jgi:NSS family neurotransmitter:Na+ symporter
MPGGIVFASMFFALFLMAALTSSISLLEVVVAYFIDDLGWSRAKAVGLLGGAIFLLGIPAALATGPWAGWSIAQLLGGTEGQGVLGSVRIFQLNWFDLISHIVSDYMLPIGGFFVCLFVGWFWNRATVEAEATLGSSGFWAMTLWVNLLRWVGPLVIGEVLVLGVLDEFPEQFFPRLAATVNALHTWFIALDILVAVVVIVMSVAAGSRSDGRQAA